MIKIAFLHEGKSYLPEIAAYERFLNNSEQFDAVIVRSADEIDESFDIIWKVMGVDLKRPRHAALVHEYNTITVGKNAKLKDLIKRTVNCKPDGRVFQNEKVRDVFHFNDAVPFVLRDMGIDAGYFGVHAEKEYDFVYVGTMDPSRQLDKMLTFFKDHPEFTIILVGTPDETLENTYGSYDNINFTGRVEYRALPHVAAKARYGLNYVPDIFPFNEQTSTKLIEYCALGLDIVTLDYKWVNEFEQQTNSKFFKVKSDLSNLSKEALDSFDFKTPDLSHMEWDRLLTDAGLIPFLTEIYQKHVAKQEA